MVSQSRRTSHLIVRELKEHVPWRWESWLNECSVESADDEQHEPQELIISVDSVQLHALRKACQFHSLSQRLCLPHVHAV